MSAGWVASLSNGESISEAKVEIVDSSKSNWRNFLQYIQDRNLEIRHIKLVVNGIEYHTPTYNAIGRYNNDANASSFWVNRRKDFILMGADSNKQDELIEVSWRVGEYRHHLIVNVKSNMTWTSVTSVTNDQTVNRAIKRIMGEDY